jgi:hypothetical protein
MLQIQKYHTETDVLINEDKTLKQVKRYNKAAINVNNIQNLGD